VTFRVHPEKLERLTAWLAELQDRSGEVRETFDHIRPIFAEYYGAPDAAHHRWTGYCEQAGVEVDIHQLRHAHATELINNGVSIEADAVLGLTARIQRFGGYATDEVALAPEPFDARHHWSGSSRSIWSKSLSALGALEEVEHSRRETVVLSDR
jgi:hypothetical protein